MWEFAKGCMRNYLILKDKARHFNEDSEVQALLSEIRSGSPAHAEELGRYSRARAERIKELPLDREKIAQKVLPYERLDQLTIDILLGVR